MRNIINDLIYLDPDYISSVYESITNDSPTTYFSRTQGKKGDRGEIFNSDVHSNETKSFTKSSLGMLKTVYSELEKYLDFVPLDFENYNGTQTVWFSGDFTMGDWKYAKTVGGEEKESQTQIFYEIKGEKYSYALLAQPHLFSSNIGTLINASPAIRRYIGIPAKTLGRVLYFLKDANFFVVTPYIIIETQK